MAAAGGGGGGSGSTAEKAKADKTEGTFSDFIKEVCYSAVVVNSDTCTHSPHR